MLKYIWIPAVLSMAGLLADPLAAAPHGGHGGGGHGGGGHAAHVGAAHAGAAHAPAVHSGTVNRGSAGIAAQRGINRGANNFARGERGRIGDYHDGYGRGGYGRGGYYGDGFFGGGLGWYPGYFLGGGWPYWDGGYDDGPYYSGYPDQPAIDSPVPNNSGAPAPAYANAPIKVPADVAVIRVIVPDPQAQVWFEGQLMNPTGTDRYFQSPPLTAGGTFRYQIRAAWTQGPRQVSQERTVLVMPGQTSIVDFTRPSPSPTPNP